MSPEQLFPVVNLTALAAWMLLAGWTHYLAFDLLVGGWEMRDSRDRGIPHVLMLPCLFLTFMFGPAGWLSYLGIRYVKVRR